MDKNQQWVAMTKKLKTDDAIFIMADIDSTDEKYASVNYAICMDAVKT